MRLTLPCLIVLLLLSCKTREKPITEEEEKAPEVPFTYDVDTLKSLNQYISYFSFRKLAQEHYCYTIIANVNVVDVKNGNILPNRNVVLHDGRIDTILLTNKKLPKIAKGYRILKINGTGQYLAPGLCDMHVHYTCENVMRLNFLTHGITSIRTAGGDKVHFDEQRMLATQRILGPNLYGAFTPENIPWITDTAYPRTDLSPAWVYIRPGPEITGAEKQLKIQNGIAVAQGNNLRVSFDSRSPIRNATYPDETAFEQWIDFPVLRTLENFHTFWFLSRFYIDSLREVSTELRAGVLAQLKRYPDHFCIGTETQRGNTSGENPVVAEMQTLSGLGVENRWIVSIATRNAGIFVNGSAPLNPWSIYPSWFGEVKKGYRADLVLLSANPLENVTNYSSPLTVFVNGVCLSKADLDEMKIASEKFSHQ